MRAGTLKWIVALTASGVLHAGAAALLLPDMDTPQIEGGAPTEVAMSGDAFTDRISAGATSDAVEPATDAVEDANPVEAERTAAEPVEAASPVETPEAIESEAAETSTPRTADQAEAVESAETPLAQPDRAKTAQSAEPVVSETASSAAALEVEETPKAEIAVATQAGQREEESVTARKAEPAEAESIESAESAPATERDDAVKPAVPEDTVQALADVPTPTPRPDYTPPKRTEKREAESREARKAPAKKTAGSGGRNRADSKRGTTSARQQGKAANDGKRTARATAAGDAAVSNYPGKVVRKLRRALRYPTGARRDRVEGEVHVRFTISRGGGIGAVRVVRSSGSPVLDTAAVATVRRAAPFPAIPSAAGRSSWPFTVPLAFVR